MSGKGKGAKAAPWQSTFEGRRAHYAKSIARAGFKQGAPPRPASDSQRSYVKRLAFRGLVPQSLFQLSEAECLTMDESAQIIEAAKRNEQGRGFALCESAYMAKKRLRSLGLTDEQAEAVVKQGR